jgi:hypothetical protein
MIVCVCVCVCVFVCVFCVWVCLCFYRFFKVCEMEAMDCSP